jgi:hypothetical protein
VASAPPRDRSARQRVRTLGIIASGLLIGLILGTIAGSTLFPSYEAHAVVQIATLGLAEPVVPMTEVKAHAESRSRVVELLSARGLGADPRDYQVLAEIEPTGASAVVKLSAQGPDSTLALALAQGASDEVLGFTNRAYDQTLEELRSMGSRSEATSGAFAAVGADDGPLASSPEHTLVGLRYGQWAAEVSSLRRDAQRALRLSRAGEVIDPPFVHCRGGRATLVSLLGSALGLLVGVALAWRRPAPAR